MRRIIIAIGFISCLAALTAEAQFIRSMGIKAGITLANQQHQITPLDYTLETTPLVGPGIGIFAEAFSGDRFSFQTDLAFITKGSKTTTRSVTVNHLDDDRIIANKGEQTASRFHYLSLSPMARFRFERDRLAPYALLGLRIDYLLKYSTDSDYPLEEQNSFIPGVTGGIGLEYDMHGPALFLELQYQTDAMPVTGKDPLLINNNIFLITLGIRYLTEE
jgi:hypothetical protein